MNDIVVCIVGMPDIKLREKIAETLRIHQIQATNNISQATVIVHIPNKAPQMTIEEIALQLIEQTQAQVFKLQEHLDIPDIPVILSKKHTNKNANIISKHSLKKFYKNKHQQKQILLHRTKCK